MDNKDINGNRELRSRWVAIEEYVQLQNEGLVKKIEDLPRTTKWRLTKNKKCRLDHRYWKLPESAATENLSRYSKEFWDYVYRDIKNKIKDDDIRSDIYLRLVEMANMGVLPNDIDKVITIVKGLCVSFARSKFKVENSKKFEAVEDNSLPYYDCENEITIWD